MLAPTLVDLADVAQSMASMLRQLIGETFDLRLATAPCGAVRADRGQLEQVVLNLVVNSRDAMPRGGTIDLTLAEVDRDGARWARLSVVDHGTGMTVPDITRAAAIYQISRIARARDISPDEIEPLLPAGDLVNVLELNLALDRAGR